MLPHWTQDDLVVNRNRLHYYRTGKGGAPGKPALVLQHSFSDTGLCWQPVAEELEATYDVVMPDARGHGLSARVQPDDKLDLAGLIRLLGLKRPVVAGHSMGARIASQLGARFPNVARALILEDPPWFAPQGAAGHPPSIGRNSTTGQWLLSLQDKTTEQVMAQCRADHPTWPESIVQRWCEGKKQLDINFLATDNGGTPDWPQAVGAIACPVLLVTADPDKGGLVTPALAQQVVAMNPLFRAVHVPGAGHHVRFGDYATYMVAVRAFLQEMRQ
jgi:pimeloyl-ACP methyl ester carboxylesterase